MPEEVEPARKHVAVERIDDHHDIGPEQDRMGKTRQLHHQQEHQQADDEILPRVRALAVDRDPIVFEQEVHERIGGDRDVERDEDMVDRRRQPLVQVALLVVKQDLQDQGERDQARGKLQRAAETRVEVPDQPDGEDQRDREYQVTDIDVTSDPVNQHRSPFVRPAPQRRRLLSRTYRLCAYLLPATFHLAFQALCSFRNLARPGCTGMSGLALMPCTCMPTKSFAIGVNPGSLFARSSLFL